jgi:ABC-2 type transport system ATP-binding protein
MQSVLLSVSGLVKSYGLRRAVDGVSFRGRAGQTIGLASLALKVLLDALNAA